MGNSTKFIPEDIYKLIVKNTVVMCVDCVIYKDGKILLVRRNNEPLKGRYWTPGGRVLKGERLIDAVKRKVKEETGLTIKPISMVGFYEDFFKKNELGLDMVHTTSIVFAASYVKGKVKLDSQSKGYRWANKLPKDLALQLMFINSNSI
jgi:colanic acid biosynthesis protein WcaH